MDKINNPSEMAEVRVTAHHCFACGKQIEIGKIECSDGTEAYGKLDLGETVVTHLLVVEEHKYRCEDCDKGLESVRVDVV